MLGSFIDGRQEINNNGLQSALDTYMCVAIIMNPVITPVNMILFVVAIILITTF